MNAKKPDKTDSSFELNKLLFFTALTSVHAGAGDSFSLVDLCIQREKITGFPFIQSTGLKGVMRDTARRIWNIKDDDEKITNLFGTAMSPETLLKDDETKSGSFVISDARILLMPVRSLAGLFAYVTCEQVLQRFKRDAELFADFGSLPESQWSSKSKDPAAGYYPHNNSSLLKATDTQCVLEDLLIGLNPDSEVTKWAEKFENWFGKDGYQISHRLLVVHDDVFSHLCDVATAVHNRNRLKTDGSKRVVEGGLFNQEFLNEYTVMYSILRLEQNRNENFPMEDVHKNLTTLCSKVWQVGANESTGKGFIMPKLIMKGGKDGTEQQVQD